MDTNKIKSQHRGARNFATGVAVAIAGATAGWFGHLNYERQFPQQVAQRTESVTYAFMNQSNGSYITAAMRFHFNSSKETDAVAVLDMRRVHGFVRYIRPIDSGTLQSLVSHVDSKDENLPLYFFMTEESETQITPHSEKKLFVDSMVSEELYERRIVLRDSQLKEKINWGDLTFLIDEVVPESQRKGLYNVTFSDINICQDLSSEPLDK